MKQEESGFRDFLRVAKIPGQLLRPAQSLCYAQQRGDFEIALHAGRQALTLNPELKDNSRFMQRCLNSNLTLVPGMPNVTPKRVRLSHGGFR